MLNTCPVKLTLFLWGFTGKESTNPRVCSNGIKIRQIGKDAVTGCSGRRNIAPNKP